MYEAHNASAAAWSPRLSMSMQRVIECDGDNMRNSDPLKKSEMFEVLF